LTEIKARGAPLLIFNEDQRFIMAEQMRQIEAEPGAILLWD
jgi:mannose-1-phosphate guanylyltransferase